MLFVSSAVDAYGGIAAVSSGSVTSTNWAQGYVANTPLVDNSAIGAGEKFSAGFCYTSGGALKVRDCTTGVPVGSQRGYNGVLVDSTGRACYSTVSRPYVGSNYLWLPGVGSNVSVTASSASLSITGNISIRQRLSVPDWTPADNYTTVAKDAIGPGSRSYHLQLRVGGNLLFAYSNDGTNMRTAQSSTAMPTTDNTPAWIRADYNTAGTVDFYYAADSVDEPTSWTALGTQQAITAGAIAATSAELVVGAFSDYVTSLLPQNTKLFRTVIYSGTTKAYDANFASVSEGSTSFTESSSNAATVTVIGTQAYVYSPVIVGGMAVAGDGRFFMTVT